MSNPQVVNFNVGAIIKSLRDARFTSVNISVQKVRLKVLLKTLDMFVLYVTNFNSCILCVCSTNVG